MLERHDPTKLAIIIGSIGEFVATVFFYLYNKTVNKMSEYHHKLVLTQNIGLAMKIVQDLPENERLAPQKLLIENLIKDINSHLCFTASNKTKHIKDA